MGKLTISLMASVIVMVVISTSLLNHQASAITTAVQDQASCLALGNTSWDAVNGQCDLSGPLTVNAGNSLVLSIGLVIENGATLTNNGDITINFVCSLSSGCTSGVITNYGNLVSSGSIESNVYDQNGATVINNRGTFTNSGTITNSGEIDNQGTVTNRGKITNNVIVHNYSILYNYNAISNTAYFDNEGTFISECGSTYTGTALSGLSIQNHCITAMSDTTASGAVSIFSSKRAQVEYVSPTSKLIGKNIDSITVKLSKFGLPTGTVQVGVLNPDTSVKKLFGTISAASLTTTPTDHTFTLSGTSRYTIQSGDRIGLLFTGGSSTDYVLVMRDTSNAFDGTNSYKQFYNTVWNSNLGEDLYMLLKQTHG